MGLEFQRIKRVLEIYLARSQAALEALKIEDWASFDTAMRWRNAAFHNFRAVDHLACIQRPDYLSEPGWYSLGLEIQTVDRDLSQMIEQHKDRLNQKLLNISRHRAKIAKFYSGVQDQSGFQKTV